MTWQEKGKLARDMIIDKVYTNNSDLTPAAILTPQQQQQAHVWVGDQKVRMMDIPQQVAAQGSQAIRAAGLPGTQAQIAAWWLKKGKSMQ